MNEKEKRIFFALIKSAAAGVALTEDEKADFNDEMLPKFYKLSKKHNIAHLIALGLELNGLDEGKSEYYKKFEKQKLIALYNQERVNYQFNEQCAVLEKNKIPFMPLKGSVIKAYYPESWMRTSCDIDILIYEKDLKRAISALKNELSYEGEGDEHYHNVSLFSPDGVHLELHFSIKEAIKNIDTLLQKVWDYSEKKENSDFEFRQTNEFLIFHIIAHMYYHFLSGGCGIKAVIDLMLLNEKLTFNKKQVYEMCKQCKIEKFYTEILKLIDIWFKEGKHTELTAFLEQFVFDGGVFGTTLNNTKIKNAYRNGRLSNFMQKVFLRKELMVPLYPILKKHYWLLPFCHAHRVLKKLFGGRGIEKTKKEIAKNKQITSDEIERISFFLKELGIE
ncbi:MAG: hypothetical protein E7548_00145 [Ruminococcaceae bacterium]|nr:hypothetical protein [Oscillospiraceae bacterium]